MYNMCVHVCTYMYTHICVYVCVYIYIHIHTYAHTHSSAARAERGPTRLARRRAVEVEVELSIIAIIR